MFDFLLGFLTYNFLKLVILNYFLLFNDLLYITCYTFVTNIAVSAG